MLYMYGTYCLITSDVQKQTIVFDRRELRTLFSMSKFSEYCAFSLSRSVLHVRPHTLTPFSQTSPMFALLHLPPLAFHQSSQLCSVLSVPSPSVTSHPSLALSSTASPPSPSRSASVLLSAPPPRPLNPPLRLPPAQPRQAQPRSRTHHSQVTAKTTI